MRKNLKVVCGTAIAAAMLLAPVLAQAADPQTQGSQATGQSQQSTATTSASTPSSKASLQQTGTPAPSVSAQGLEPSAQGGDCSDTGPMTHGRWTLAPSAEYGGECTLTFTATDPVQENDFTGLESDFSHMYGAYAHMGTIHNFSNANHIVFDGVNKTKLPENASFMFGDWNYGFESFDSNNHLDTSHTKNMQGMFQASYTMRDLDLSGWDTSSLENMTSMFDGCGVSSLDLSGWNTSSLNTTRWAFWGMLHLKALNLSGWDTGNVEDMYQMFGWDDFNMLTIGPKTKLTNLDETSFDNDPNYPGTWLKVTKLSDGTSGTTQADTDSTPEEIYDFSLTLSNDPERAGTYVWTNNRQQTLSLYANLPSGYTATADADGYTADELGNLHATASGTRVSNVPMPQYDADGHLVNHGTPQTIDTMKADIKLPTGDPFTLSAAPETTDTYTFKGWSDAQNATAANHNDGDTINISGANTTLYAVWKKDVEENNHHETTPVPSTPSENTPSSSEPSGSTPSTSTPSGSTPSGSTPSTGTPSGSTPSTGTPSENTTSVGTSSASTSTPSASKPSNTTETGKPSTSASGAHHTDGNTGNVTVQSATPAPALSAPVSTSTVPTLAPAAAALPAAQILATPAAATTAPATAAVAVAPRTGTAATPINPTTPTPADQSIGQVPNNVAPQEKQKSCEIAYYAEGSVAPAAVICKPDGTTMTPIATSGHIASTVAPAWLFMLVLAAVSLIAMFLYRRRNEFLAAQHRAEAVA
ncbi:BspA family leucine-rich repeat surface protein [Bifidobacterium sp. ESL0745]|uniref:BspA family leucine-rich repeat surface protein n=1 Tax=Bifidobacterium sp. ESL0745 TaxID=2983226 RepID=UPI0023F6314E|nr:BspA family leucine-rich repeat surface protein [Bifidobacterium sp. ESL0745]MDF7666062.1 BspA family leucine-rich repeat surface protein [Bifidobacterium sp. ESL0745]